MNNYFFLSLILSILFSCKEKKVKLYVKNEAIHTLSSQINFILKNNTKKNYFILIDTNRMFDYPSYNRDINRSIHLNPIISYENKIIEQKIFFSTYHNKKLIDCQKEEKLKADLILANLDKNVVLLKSNSKTYINIPFKIDNNICNNEYQYNLKLKKKYLLKFDYVMNKDLIESEKFKSVIINLKKRGFEPCYDKLESNEISFVISPLFEE